MNPLKDRSERHVLRRLALILTAAVIVIPDAAAAVEPKPDPRCQREIVRLKGKLGPTFTVKQVGMFVVAHDLDTEPAAQYETLISQQEKLLYDKWFGTRPEYVIKIVLFRDNASLRKSAKKVAEKSAVMPGGGFYLAYERVLCVDTGVGAWVLKHELTHAMLHADWRREKLTQWIDEGMAMLVESCTFTDDDIELRLDWRLPVVHRLMKAQKLPHLKDVFRMDFRTYNRPENRMVCDAVARNFLFYLHEKGLLVGFYRRYRNNYSQDPSGIKFAEAFLKKDIDAIEADWLAWVTEKAAPPQGTRRGEREPTDH